MAARRTRKDDGSNWTVADSRGVYGIRHWGAGYFAINDGGNVEVRPQGADSTPIDLYELVGQLREAGLSLPLLVRFPDILQDRVRKLTGAFDANIERLEYQSRYTALYPIKVNQQEAVVENIIATENVSIGLEAGSKPELMAVLALAPKGGTIVCNGYKDREFIKLALMGQKLGHNVFIVIEKESEVQLVIEEAANVGVQPQVGLRVRLSSLASSKWADTGGEKAKFGLSAAQLLSVVERFRQAGLDQGVRLLHEAGVPQDAVQLLPGDGKTGAALVGSPLTAGVMFTGSTEVARLIQGQLAGRVHRLVGVLGLLELVE